MRIALTAAGFSVPLLFTTGALSSPEIQQQGPVSFVSGGIGLTEVQEMKDLSSGFPVEMLFVTDSIPPNRYLTGINVQIKDKNGNVVLDTASLGPFLLAKMPSGKYSISAESEGTFRQRTIQVVDGKTTQRVMFVWNQPVDQ